MSWLIKRASGNGVRLFIDPEGREHDIGDLSHGEWAAENFDPIYMDDDETVDSGEMINRMLESGWVRVGDQFEANSQFAIEVADLTRIPPSVDAVIAEHYNASGDFSGIGSGIEFSDLQDRHVIVHDPFPSIQKAVTRALRSPKQAARTAGGAARPRSDFKGALARGVLA